MKIEAGKWYETRGGDVVQAEKYEDADERIYPYFYTLRGREFSVDEDGFIFDCFQEHICDLIKEVAAPEPKQESKFVPTHVDSLTKDPIMFYGTNPVSGRRVHKQIWRRLYSQGWRRNPLHTAT